MVPWFDKNEPDWGWTIGALVIMAIVILFIVKGCV